MKRLLIVGTGGSGTQYMARLLSRLGLRAKHEGVFSHEAKSEAAFDAWPPDLLVESSLFAVPFAARRPADVTLWYVVRHPLAVVRSLLRKGVFRDQPKWTKFLTARGVQPAVTQDISVVRYVLTWHQAIMAAKPDVGPTPVEHLVESEGLEAALGKVGITVSRERVAEALAAVPSTINTCGDKTDDARITFASLTALDTAEGGRLQELAGRLGYES